MKHLEDKIKNIPEKPGIYQFKNKEGRVIYVGKAKNLKKRVKQYFRETFTNQFYSDSKTLAMLSKVQDVEVISTDSEVEALLLEQNMIKMLKPRYNVNLKDDKSYPYIVITNEPFPRVFPTRNKKSDGSKYFGPYTDVKVMRRSLKILRDIFKVRTCNLNLTESAIEEKKFKICLEYHIKKCDGPCEGFMSKEDYNSMIKQISLLLNGKIESVIKELEKEMDIKSKEMKFEDAAEIRDKIETLRIYIEKQKIIYETSEDIDVFAVEKTDDDACGVVLKIRDGKTIGRSHYYISNVLNVTEKEILEKFIVKYYSENDFIPDKIILPKIVMEDKIKNNIAIQDLETKSKNNEINNDTEIEFLQTIQDWLNTKRKLNNIEEKLKIIIPQKDEELKLVTMVKANAKLMLDELLIMKTKKYFIPSALESLKRDLMLENIPRRIECFDISHIQGSDMVGSLVVFQDGKPRKSEYRKYKIQHTKKIDENFNNNEGNLVYNIPDDYAAIREVIYRRFSKLSKENSENVIPDLIIIDGGKGQLNAAIKVLKDLNLYSKDKKPFVISLAKRLEEVYFPEREGPYNIPKSSSGLKLLQKIRDEAHRFAVTFHQQLRAKRTVKTELLDIKGIGKITAEKLLRKFGSVEEIKKLIIENPSKVIEIIGKKQTQILEKYFKKK